MWVKKTRWMLLLSGFLILSLLIIFSGLAMAVVEDGKDQPLVTTTFFESDLREALREVALQTGVNIATDENVKGTISMELKKVPLEKALRMMLIGGGFSFRKVEDFYVVGLADAKNPSFKDLCETGVYCFQNINGESAKALLPAAYENFVRIDLNRGLATINAPPDLLQRIMADLAKLDGKRQQVKVKALITAVRNEVLKEWGINLLNRDWTAPTAGAGPSYSLDLTNGLLNLDAFGDFGHITAAIKALEKDKKAKIYADPVIVVDEGKNGELFVGDRRTIILQSANASDKIENIEAGTTLKVTPRLLGSQIELGITQKVSSFNEESSDSISVRSNEFSSSLCIPSGGTMMVVGLTENQSLNQVSKVPILGDIPLIRLLFKHKSGLKTDSQLLIFITAEVVK
jgi:type IV pilus assembly protein PilQ